MDCHPRNLSFTYPGAQTPTLKDINIVIEPGETLAIVGFNGGGKTTLVKVTRKLCHSEPQVLLAHYHPFHFLGLDGFIRLPRDTPDQRQASFIVQQIIVTRSYNCLFPRLREVQFDCQG